MTSIDPEQSRRFAIEVVKKLRQAGFQAYWAGGCVRDQLLNREPKDYDVATNATPDEIREVFGPRRTLAIGAAFGVIIVLGPKTANQVEVATFRRDAQYSDGRHPDSVTFSSAEEDAQRRDFTINGLFYDPIDKRIIDYVDGHEDLRQRLVRAIGDPFARIAEDKLRMLRAVRMASTFDFALDASTLSAVEQKAHELTVVSAERITSELRLMLVHPNRCRAARLLAESRLLTVILPALQGIAPEGSGQLDDAPWQRTRRVLECLDDPTFSMAFAALIRECAPSAKRRVPEVSRIAERLRLTNKEERETEFLLAHEHQVRSASRIPWPQLQRILVQEGATDLVAYSHAVAEATGEGTHETDFCRDKLSLPKEELDPPPLLGGNDLKVAGLPPGPAYKRIIEAVRDAQLENRVGTKQEALDLARQLSSQTADDAHEFRFRTLEDRHSRGHR